MKNGNTYLAEAESGRVRRTEKKIREEKNAFFLCGFHRFKFLRMSFSMKK